MKKQKVLPEIGSTYEYKGLQRKVITIIDNTGSENNYDIIWSRPDNPQREYRIWFKYWWVWAKHAKKIN